MIDASLIKTLLDHEVYQNTSTRLRADLFAEDFRELYRAVDEAHKTYGTSLSLDEVLAVWDLTHPVATRTERAEIKDILDEVRKSEALNHQLAQDAVEALWRRSLGKQIAEYGLEMSEGQSEAMSKLQSLLERHSEGWLPDDFGEPTSDDLVELIKKVGDDGRWKFNIETLSRHVHGIGPQEFGIIFATPETGKTAFVVSLAVAPGGFIDQGAKVLVLGNEESTERTQVRAACAATGLTALEIADDPEKARQIYRARKQDRLIFKDTQDWDLDRIEAYISKQKPDVVFIDQADKVQIGGLFNAGHERLR
jgi:replicative DNA helicase